MEEENSRSQFPSEEEEEYSRSLFPSEEEEKEYSRTHFPCRRRRDKFHVFMSAVKMAFHVVSSG